MASGGIRDWLSRVLLLFTGRIVTHSESVANGLSSNHMAVIDGRSARATTPMHPMKLSSCIVVHQSCDWITKYILLGTCTMMVMDADEHVEILAAAAQTGSKVQVAQ